ncbi:hypothetical protein N0V90_004856 [Kalmusia sp. IMI 367209]|nr:hypothetical protein N0V90_004856 [Kalmusia sp. IMI 367209]
MARLPIPHLARITRLTPIITRHSSGSPSSSSAPDEQFIKSAIDQRSYEYSQSGGDDMVASQEGASFSADADSA